MIIYLIGITGSGKSTLGKQLAQSLKMNFVDLDDYIVEKEKKSIENIFEESGEAHFRLLESEALKLNSKDNYIISTGGGTPCFHDGIDYMLNHGTIIWINPDAETVTERLIKAKNSQNRPLVKSKSKEEVLTFIKEKLKERNQYYSKAHIIITHNDITVNMLENAISLD
ncbi:MAG: shikimate kinase [Cytophagales bacterium]